MPALYCDQNVLITVCDAEGFPPVGPFGRLLDSRRVDFVFSTTHLIEAARMRSMQQATEMAQLLDLASRRWLPDRITLELDEIRHTLAGGPAPEVLLTTMTEVAAKLNNPRRPPEIVTALRLVQGWNRDPRLFEPMLRSHRQNVRAFKTNARSTKKGKLKRVPDVDLMRPVVRNLAAIHQIAVDENRLAALNVVSMPTLHTELVLSRLRWSRGGNFRWQSFMDGEHLIVAMPHVDLYMTFDMRKRKLAHTLKQQCSSCRATVVGSFDDVARALT